MTRLNSTIRFGLSGQAKIRLIVSVALYQVLASPGSVYALPAGAENQFGQATFQTNGNHLTINQTTRQLITNWQSFGIASNESVQLLQSTQGVALFRVVGPEASQIFGNLSATGSLFLINPNGVLFGQNAQVDVGSLVATSMNISNTDFLNGHYQFNAEGSTGSVINQGVIKVADGGYLVMLGNEVKNSGTLNAANGSVVMGSAQSAILDFYGNGLVKARLSGDALNALVEQTGNVHADGGSVQLATNSRSSAVNVSGLVQANSLVERNGVIRLEGGNNAKVSVSGTLNAVGNQAGTKGGSIEVTGEQVALFKGAKLDASGHSGGGKVLVGGDYQGKNTQVQNARTTYVDNNTTISADANERGDGGRVIVWADEITRYYGGISAKGGINGGNGGFAEVSGKRLLNFLGKVDLSASQGIGGNLLLDPANIILSTGADNNTTGFTSPGDITEAFADDAGLNSVFKVNTGGSFAGIAAGSTITLQATNNITVSNTFNVATATGSANNSLVLQANNNIAVNAAVTTSGTGSITMNANADNTGGGNLTIAANITSQSGGITLTGENISRSAGSIASTGVAGSNAGNISIIGTSTVNLGAATVIANGGTASAGTSGRNGGAIIITGAGVTTTGAISANGSAGNGANQAGGDAGSVAITSTNGMSVGAITASGGNAGTGVANGGNAGIITLTNNTAGNIAAGNLTARTGNAIGTGASGVIGVINVTNNASGTLTTGALNTLGGRKGDGGNVSVTSAGNLATGAITTSGGTTLTDNAGRNAGAINLNAGGSVITANIAANGTSGLGTNQNGGDAANITITATAGIKTAAVTASGGHASTTNGNGGNAGAINISNSTSGDLVTTTLTARTGNARGTSNAGTAGSITVNNSAVAGNLTTGNISTQGNLKGDGGNVSVTSAGNLATGAITTSGGTTLTDNAGRNAGAINLNAGGSVITANIAANGTSGLGANQNGGDAANITITATAGIKTAAVTASGGHASTTNGNAGNAGAINISNSTSGNIVTTTLTARTGNAAGTGNSGTAGSITVNNTAVAGNLTTGNISTQGGTKGAGGNVSVTSAGNLVTGAVTTSGGTTLTGNAGRNAGVVAIDSAGNTTVGAIAATGSAGVGTNQNGGSGGVVNLGAGVSNTITMTNVTTTGGNRTGSGVAGVGGNVAVAEAALLSANTTITTTGGSAGVGAGGAVNFNSTVNSFGANRTLTINSNGATTFNGAVGNILALASLATNATGTTAINGGAVTTTGAQTYSDNVAIGATTTLTTNNSNVTFTTASSVVNAAGNNLTIATGSGTVSATSAANNFANLAVTAGNANIRDVNAIVLGATNVTGNYTLQTAGAVTQTAGVTVGGATTLNAGTGNDITLNNAANDFNSVVITSARDVSLAAANALTIGASSLRTISAQTLSGDLTLGGNIAATGMGSGTSITLASAQNFLNPGNRNLTPGAGARWLVYSTNPVADTRGVGLIAASNFKQYNAGLGDTILGAGNGFVYSVAPTITASLTGTASKGYDGNFTASIAGLTLGQTGEIDGDTVNLSAFTSATYDDKNAGTNKTVSSNALTITGATNGGKQVFGYQLVSANATGDVGTINKANLNINAVTDSKTYDGTTASAGVVSIGTLFGSDTVTDATQVFASSNVLGTNNSTLNVSGFTVNDGNGGNNYTVSSASASGTINQRAITVTANSGQTKFVGNVDPLPFTFTVGGLGLIGGDTLSGALDRLPGEVVGNYAINQGTLDAGGNYIINYVSDLFTILVPGGASQGNGSPRDAAGLGGLLALNERPIQSLAILNVAAPSAGDGADADNSAEACESSADRKLNNPNISIMFNFGMKLPKGVKPICI